MGVRYDMETKAQSSQWKTHTSSRLKKACQMKYNVKVMLAVFFAWKGIVYHEFISRGEIIHRFHYLETLRHLRQAVRKKRPEMWSSGEWLLHHDNSPVHSLLFIRDFCTKNAMTDVPQPSYSPNLVPADFFLFPKIKRPMKGERFDDVEAIKKNR